MKHKLSLNTALVTVSLAIGLLALAWSLARGAAAGPTGPTGAPGIVSYQGFLSDAAGQPLSGTVTLAFALYATASGGEPLWQETHPDTSITAGYFTVLLGSINPLSSAKFTSPTRFLELSVDAGDGPVLMPRQQLAAVPYALQAEAAQTAGTALTATLALSASQAPWRGVTGVPAGFADGTDDSAHYANVVVVAKAGGDYTSIQAAVDSLTGTTATSPALVWVAPGTYNETVQLKPHVHLRGAGPEATVIISAASGSAQDLQATVALGAFTSLRDLSVANTGTGAQNIALLAPSGTLSATVQNVVARAAGGGGIAIGIYVNGEPAGGHPTNVALLDVSATGENGSDGNYGLFVQAATARVDGGYHLARGGGTAYALWNGEEAVLAADGATALGEDGVTRSCGLINAGVARLSGGSFTGRGGSEACGVQNRSTLDALGITALGEDGSSNFGLENYQNTTRLNSGFYTARGGAVSTGIKNGRQGALLEAQGVAALAESATTDNIGMDHSGDQVWLVSGSFHARGGQNAYGISVPNLDSVLVAHDVSALAEAATSSNHGLHSWGIDTALDLVGGSFTARGGLAAAGLYDQSIGSNHRMTADHVTAVGSGASGSNHGLFSSAVVTVTASRLAGAPAVMVDDEGNVFLGASELDGGYSGAGAIRCASAYDGGGYLLDAACRRETEDGTAKAAVMAFCGNSNSRITRAYNRLADPGDMTVFNGDGLGECTIDLAFDVSGRYWAATAVSRTENRSVACEAQGTSYPRLLDCFVFTSAGTGTNDDIMVIIY